jgi:hypothetical protein
MSPERLEGERDESERIDVMAWVSHRWKVEEVNGMAAHQNHRHQRRGDDVDV